MPEQQTEPRDHLRILVVEDEIELGRNICAFLDSRGHRSTHAETLDDALNVIENETALDVVISDIYLAAADGELRPGGIAVSEACGTRKPGIPVVLLTGHPSLDTVLEGLRKHAFDFLMKPVAMPQLEHAVRRAIDSRRLLQRLDELEEVTAILSRILPNAIEAKDPSTRGHSDRVAGYADTLGRRCGLSLDERTELRLAAMLHDVGKIGVPESILTKPGALTRDEREEIKKHPGIGYKILEPLQSMPRVRDWVYQHHERWDGRGYPEGLGGDDVALPGRILILAEVYDALATARSYKAAWPRDKIADYFEQDAGTHFDPELSKLVASGVRERGTAWFETIETNGVGAGQTGQLDLF